MRAKSTSIALVTWAPVSRERRMCSAMPRRIAVIGSSVSPGRVSPAATGAGAAGLGLGRRLCGGRLGRSGLGPRLLGGSLCSRGAADLAELRPDVHGLAFLDEDLRQRPGGRARHLGVHLVGGDLEQGLVGLDLLA